VTQAAKEDHLFHCLLDTTDNKEIKQNKFSCNCLSQTEVVSECVGFNITLNT